MATARRRLALAGDVLDPWEGVGKTIEELLDERGQRREHEETQQRRRLRYVEDWLPLVPEAHGPVDTRRFAFQVEPLYSETAVTDREQVHMKATQVGWSTGAIRIGLYGAAELGYAVLYTFPTKAELTPFSQFRFGPIIRASPHLAARMRQEDGGAVDNVGTKRFGMNGWLFLRGTDKPIESLPIDLAIFDEYDYSDQENINDSEYRVTGPNSRGLIRRLGVPTIPGFGIDALYEASDQRVWHVKCEACGDWNPIKGLEAFHANVDQDEGVLVCRRHTCRRALDVRDGEWVAAHPDRDVKGYHAPKLLMPGRRVLAGVIARSRKTKESQKTAFLNRDLGEAYAPSDGRLSLEQVQACVRPDLRPLDPTVRAPSSRPRFMGIDVASVRALNVTIEEGSPDPQDPIARKLWVGEVENDPARGTAFAQVCRIIDALGINMVGIDSAPEGRFGIALRARYPGRVYRIGFFSPGPQQKREPAPMNVDDTEGYVSLWRTRAYEATFARFRTQSVHLPPLETLPEDYAEQLGNLYRRKVEVSRKAPDGRQTESTGVVRVDYVKTGPEDYAQAEAYCLAAVELYWRAVGLGLALNQQPVPLAQVDPYVAAPEDEDDYGPGGGEPLYRSPFG